MHGQVKVRTTEEVAAAKAKERAEKARMYVALRDKIIAKRLAGELDDKALTMTETILTHNPDFSTIWNFRREILLKKLTDLSEDERVAVCVTELKFVEACIAKNPKSYNSWHQRRWVLLTTPRPDWHAEIALCSKFLQLDERNFHGWDYRRFVVVHMPDADAAARSEFEYSMERISKNFSNYSAWHYRSTLLPRLTPGPPLPADVLAREVDVVHNAFYIEPKDQSAWFYHRWLLGREDLPPVFVAAHAAREADGALTLALAFSKPLELPMHAVTVTIDGTAVPLIWSSNSSQAAAALWLASIPSGVAVGATIVLQHASDALRSDAAASTLSAPGPASIATVRVCGDPAAALALWRPMHPHILQQELTVCQELLEVLDPGLERKWALLASLHIASAIGTAEANAVCDTALAQLLESDPIRAGFYRDLHGRIAVNRAVTGLLAGPPEEPASLVNLGLTRLTVAPLLAGARAVNLSGNSLTSLNGALGFRFVRTLVLDRNRITHVPDLAGLTHLQRLSLQHNHVSAAASLAGLASGLTVFLFGNPIADGEKETGLTVHIVWEETDVWATA